MVARSTFNPYIPNSFSPDALTYSDKEEVLRTGRGLRPIARDFGKPQVPTRGREEARREIEREGDAGGSPASRVSVNEETAALTPQEARAALRKKSFDWQMENPIIKARYNEIQRRTTADLIRPDVVEYWEKSAREGAQEHKDSLLRKARSMGLNAAQMEALSQGMQKADAAFEAKIEALRLESRRSANEELENFTLLLQEKGSAQIATEQALALEKEKTRAAESRTLWGAILGGVGGVLGGVAGYFGTGMNPMGAVAGFSAGSAALGSVGSAI